MKKLLLSCAVLAALLGAAWSSSASAENRCGWIENPTPANWWLTDSDGQWIIMSQGEEEGPEGMDMIGDISAGDYVATNGYYGYGCACMNVDTDESQNRITRIMSFRQLPLSKCTNDPALPQQN